MASTERYQRIRAYMVEAVGRTTGDRFARWRRFTSFSKKVQQRVKFGKLIQLLMDEFIGKWIGLFCTAQSFWQR